MSKIKLRFLLLLDKNDRGRQLALRSLIEIQADSRKAKPFELAFLFEVDFQTIQEMEGYFPAFSAKEA